MMGFVDHYGGIEKLCADVWGRYFCAEYTRCVANGITPSTAANQAD